MLLAITCRPDEVDQAQELVRRGAPAGSSLIWGELERPFEHVASFCVDVVAGRPATEDGLRRL